MVIDAFVKYSFVSLYLMTRHFCDVSDNPREKYDKINVYDGGKSVIRHKLLCAQFVIVKNINIIFQVYF